MFDATRAPLPYWLSTPAVSGADVAETSYTAFSDAGAIEVRLVVRRVRPTPGSQLGLFTTWDYHAFATNRPGDLEEIEADHVVTRSSSNASPSSRAPAWRSCRRGLHGHAAWLALAVMAHNLARAVGQLAGSGLEKATVSTLQQRVFTVPGRLVRSGRRRHLRLPASWPWASAIAQALATIQATPLRC